MTKQEWFENHQGEEAVTLKGFGLRVEMEYDGEGVDGDYFHDDPNDEPLMRFWVFDKEEDGEQMDNGSFCTQLKAYDDGATIDKAVNLILHEAKEAVKAGQGFKRKMAELSWLSADDGRLG